MMNAKSIKWNEMHSTEQIEDDKNDILDDFVWN